MKQTILITGASGAIGGMTAYAAALQKYDIIMAYRTRKTECEELAGQLEKMGSNVKSVAADICTREGRMALYQAAESFGGIDILVNNAGISHYAALSDTDDQTLEQVIASNLTAHMALTRDLLPLFLRRQKGAIVNISSVWGECGAAGEVAYSAAKAGLIGFTKALAKELAPSHITVNCVAPGVVQSKMLDALTPNDLHLLCDRIPLSRFADGLEIARVVLFTAQQEYMTGQVISPNGGLHI